MECVAIRSLNSGRIPIRSWCELTKSTAVYFNWTSLGEPRKRTQNTAGKVKKDKKSRWSHGLLLAAGCVGQCRKTDRIQLSCSCAETSVAVKEVPKRAVRCQSVFMRCELVLNFLFPTFVAIPGVFRPLKVETAKRCSGRVLLLLVAQGPNKSCGGGANRWSLDLAAFTLTKFAQIWCEH